MQIFIEIAIKNCKKILGECSQPIGKQQSGNGVVRGMVRDIVVGNRLKKKKNAARYAGSVGINNYLVIYSF